MMGPSPSRGAFGMNRQDATFTFLAAFFVVVLVLTNVVGVKLFLLFPEGRPGWMPGVGPLTLTAGLVTYPLTFLLTDLVSELWGKRRANFMVLMGFLMSLVMLAIIRLALALPVSDLWNHRALGLDAQAMQRAFEATFSTQGLLLFASMLAYLLAQLADVRLYHFWWRVTKGKHMWIRNNGSTAISQLIDTTIVNAIFLRGALHMEWGQIVEMIVAVYLCKLVLAVLDTPLLYLARSVLRRRLGIQAEAAPLKAPLD